jgi:hypothetical protein
MKTTNTMTTSENPLQNERQEITEQARCPMIRFIVDDAAYVLRYSYLMRAECRTRNGRDQIEIVWPHVTVTIEGYHLDLILDWLAQQRLHSVTLHTEIEQERKEGQPYLERILFTENID